MKRNGGGRVDSGDVAKRAKVDSVQNPPSKVLFITSLPSDVSEGEVVQLGLPFGRMTAMILNRKKNQCFLEMADLDIAETMVSYYTERPPKIGQRSVHVRYSNYDHLSMENNAQNAGCIAALKAADQLLDGVEEPRATLRIIIDNMQYPITIEILHKIFSKFGQVLRIVTFTKNNQFHAFVEYGNPILATAAKNSLNGQNIYNGCCTLRVDYSKLDKLTVKYNNDKMWDFTNPNLSTGDGGHMGGSEGAMRGIGNMMGGSDSYGHSRRRQGGARDFDDYEDNLDNNTGMGGGYRGESSRSGSMGGKMSGLGGNMSGMESNMVGMGGNMNRMAGNMGGMGGNIGGMGKNMGGMGGNLGGMGGNMSALAQNMMGMGGMMGNMAGNMGGMGGNLGGMVGNMGGMAGNMGMLTGNMAGILGNMGSPMGNMGGMGSMMSNMNPLTGNMGGMGGNMGRMSGNMGNSGGIPSLMGNIPGLSGNIGSGMMPGANSMGGVGSFMSNVGNLMGGGMMSESMSGMGGKRNMDRGNRTGMSERMGKEYTIDSGNRKESSRGDYGGSGCVIMSSNMDEKRITPDNIFTLFGLYGDVVRVKILFNKKDSALVEYGDPEQAQFAVTHLNHALWWGKEIRVSRSKHLRIMEPKEGVAEAWLTKDFTNSPLHRFKNPNSKNYNNIYPPSSTLHLSNITPETSEDMLRELFGEVGRVVAFKFFQKDRKMAFIQMSSVEDAISALVELHNYELGPRSNLRVSFTQSTIRD